MNIIDNINSDIKCSYLVLDYLKTYDNFIPPIKNTPTKIKDKLFEMGCINNHIVYLDVCPTIKQNIIYDLDNNEIIEIDNLL